MKLALAYKFELFESFMEKLDHRQVKKDVIHEFSNGDAGTFSKYINERERVTAANHANLTRAMNSVLQDRLNPVKQELQAADFVFGSYLQCARQLLSVANAARPLQAADNKRKMQELLLDALVPGFDPAPDYALVVSNLGRTNSKFPILEKEFETGVGAVFHFGDEIAFKLMGDCPVGTEAKIIFLRLPEDAVGGGPDLDWSDQWSDHVRSFRGLTVGKHTTSHALLPPRPTGTLSGKYLVLCLFAHSETGRILLDNLFEKQSQEWSPEAKYFHAIRELEGSPAVKSGHVKLARQTYTLKNRI